MDIWLAFSRSLGINKPATQLVVGGYTFVMAAISLKFMLEKDGVSIWAILGVLAAAIVLLLLLVALPMAMRRAFSILVMILFFVYVGCILAQAISGNRLPLNTAHCIATLSMVDPCRDRTPAALPKSAQVETVVEVAPIIVPDSPNNDGSGDSLQPVIVLPSLATQDAPPPEGLRVFIQFAGLERDSVRNLAESLGDRGWHIPDARRGGENIATAAGLNEVRFFHAEDVQLAQQLARNLRDDLDRAIAVKDLSATRWNNDLPAKHLEVWISAD